VPAEDGRLISAPDGRDRALRRLERRPMPNVMKGLEGSVRQTLANALGHVGA
jgi:hypothetical protein